MPLHHERGETTVHPMAALCHHSICESFQIRRDIRQEVGVSSRLFMKEMGHGKPVLAILELSYFGFS
jgi:hypothetical protein